MHGTFCLTIAMNLLHRPELLDRLAAAYALGTLRGGARRRFETLAREQAAVRAAAFTWQSRLASINELQPGAKPADAVWTRISNLVEADEQARTMSAARAQPAGGWRRNLWLWRGTSMAGVVATALAVVVGVNLRDQLSQEIQQLQAQVRATPRISYVAVLNDAQTAAAMLVTFDPESRRLSLQRVTNYQEAASQSLQLWALPPSGHPKSLGVLGTERILHLSAGEADMSNASALAISLEPKGGVPEKNGPTGPVLFKGVLIHRST